jgi:GR25 family glycosyltransferase involved in LPS biosynthesis
MGTQSTIVGIPVYVISLRDCETRRRNMTERLGALGIPFQFVDAIDGRLELPEVFDGAQVRRFGDAGTIGCALSHRLVHRMIVESGSDLGLIFEDDAVLSDDFGEVLAAAAELEFDVFKLEGGRHHYRYVPVGRIGKYSVEVGMVPSLGAAAYLLTRSGAERFCSLGSIDQHPDVAFGDPRLCLRVLELNPFAAIQEHRISGAPVAWHDDEQSLFAKLSYSFWKRWRLARAHGLWMVAAMERTRFGPH